MEFCEATPIGLLIDESKESLYGRETDRDVIFILFSPININILITSSVGGGGGVLPDFLFCSFFLVQQTTSGIGHRVRSLIWFSW